MWGNNIEEMQFLSPEVVEKLRTKGLAGNEKKFRKLQDGQLWWDLGIILYRLCTSNNLPFQNAQQGVVLKLIEKYPVSFPSNLPQPVSDELKALIRDLLTKKKGERLGRVDHGGVQDVL